MKKKTRHGPPGCPAEDCSGGSSVRQQEITNNQLARLPIEIQEKIKESHGAQRCTYCGCVYTRSPNVEKMGYLDSGILGDGWHKIG